MAGPGPGGRVPAAAGQPALETDATPGQPVPRAVSLVTRDPALLSAAADLVDAGGSLRSVLQVSVIRAGRPGDEPLPSISGRHTLQEDGIRFTPHLPFEVGLHHRALFDPRPLGCPGHPDMLTLDFSRPAEHDDLPVVVEHIFPSADALPENLLRFHVCFSQPMRRGQAGIEVSLLGPDGEAAQDALYRAPVELWDRSMRCLTILLDPGRIKRGVGPNRELGPPLRAGQACTLAVGAGMTAASGIRLSATVHKRFIVTAPVRRPIGTEEWELVPPPAGSREPLLLRFPRPLDWALLRQAFMVATEGGDRVGGHVETGKSEQEAGFTPAAPWAADVHRVAIAADLEDVCGNRPDSAFERPFRGHGGPAEMVPTLSLLFRPRQPILPRVSPVPDP